MQAWFCEAERSGKRGYYLTVWIHIWTWMEMPNRMENDGIILEKISPKNVIRQAWQAKYISNAEEWIEMISARNLELHLSSWRFFQDSQYYTEKIFSAFTIITYIFKKRYLNMVAGLTNQYIGILKDIFKKFPDIDRVKVIWLKGQRKLQNLQRYWFVNWRNSWFYHSFQDKTGFGWIGYPLSDRNTKL